MTDIASLGLEVRSDGVVIASDRLNKFGQDAARAEKATENLSSAFRRFAPIIGAVTAALSVRALKSYADGWSDMQSRVGAAVKNMEAAPALMERMVDVANASYSPLAQTVEVYGRNVAVLRDLGKGAVEAADFTEALNHALVTTATKGQDADVVLNALSRSIATGKLRAMEYETIMSRSPRVLEAVAKELGTTTTGLRALAQQGKVTGTVIVDGLVKSLEELREEAGAMPATIGDALVRLDTNFGALVGRIDQATGVSEGFAQNLIWVADTMRAWTDTIVQAAIFVQTGFNAAIEAASGVLSALGGSFDSTSALIIAGAGAAAFAVTALTGAIAMGLISAVTALSAALLANPFALLIAGAAAAVTASYLFRDEIAEIIGVDLFKVFYDGANTIIGQMKGAYDAVVAIWKHLPAYFGSIGKLAWNALMEGLSGEIISWTNPFTGEKSSFGIDFSGLKTNLNETESYVEAVAGAAYRAAQGVDYLRGAGEGISTMWSDAGDAMAKFGEIANTAGGKAVAAFDPKAAKEAEKLAKAYAKIIAGGEQFITMQELERRALGMTAMEADKARHFQELLNQANQAGINLDALAADGIRSKYQELEELSYRMAEAAQATRAATEMQNAFNDAAQGMGGWLKGLADKTKDFRQHLLDLIPIVLRLLNTMNMAHGGAGIFGGGIFQSFLGGLLGVGFANGGYTGAGGASQPAGIVHAGEYVMSKAAVDRLGVGYLDALHNAAKGYQMGGYVRSHAPANVNLRGYQSGGYVQRHSGGQEAIKIELVSRFDADGGFEQAVERSSRPVAIQESSRAAGKVASAVPSMVDARGNEQQFRRIRPGGGF